MNYYELKQAFSPVNDGTYDLHTGEAVNLTGGYQVSFERPNDDYTPEQYNDIVGVFVALHGTAYIGVWGGSKELSFNIPIRELAIRIAKIWDQDAIWDWSKMEAIETR